MRTTAISDCPSMCATPAGYPGGGARIVVFGNPRARDSTARAELGANCPRSDCLNGAVLGTSARSLT